MTPLTLSSLRARHPALTYCCYRITPGEQSLTIDYTFRLEPDLEFNPQIVIPSRRGKSDQITDRLVFLLGMIELLSYWKTACPGKIVIEAGALSAYEIRWWETLYRRGLGEFFFLNNISPQIDFEISAKQEEASKPAGDLAQPLRGAIVLVGGGKDSIVTLENAKQLSLLGNDPLAALCVNPIPASLEAIALAGYSGPLLIKRSLDPKLRELNAAGYLNGHTPYSAFLAFVSTLAAWQNGYAQVLASNETSASEGNAFFEGIEVNHQYSKSFEFENNFRSYLKQLNIPVSYFSILRPLNELQICALFSKAPAFHSVFRSCNREQTQDARARAAETSTVAKPGEKRKGWCGTCPKCVFTFLCLSCFLELSDAEAIFGASPLIHSGFLETVAELAGQREHKPFECVGTYQEVQAALANLNRKLAGAGSEFKELRTRLAALIPEDAPSLRELLDHWDKRNFLPSALAEELRERLASATEGLGS